MKTSRYLNRTYNRLCDYKFGITTCGSDVHDKDAKDYHDILAKGDHAYVTTSYRDIFKILKYISLDEKDVFIDIGCGKGRVVCCASLLNIAEAIGIDIDENYCDIANNNSQRIHNQASIHIINTCAESFDYKNCTCFWLYNPFGADVLKKVLSRIYHSLEANPRPIKIIYLVPWYDSVLESTKWLKMYDRWEPDDHHKLSYDVSFWNNN